KGAFAARRDYVQSTAGNIILTDFDADARTDIVIGTGSAGILSGTAVAVVRGRGDGSFSDSQGAIVPGFANFNNPGITLESADFDGDGIPDVIMSDLQTGITVFRGSADGTFKYAWRQDRATTKGFACSIVIGDFNRDGILDFAAVIDSVTPA